MGHLLSLPLNFNWPFDVLRRIDTVPVQGQSSVGLADSSSFLEALSHSARGASSFMGREMDRDRERDPDSPSLFQSPQMRYVNKVVI